MSSKIDSASIQQLHLISNLLRQEVITMISQAGSGHPAGSLGMADIFTCLYFSVLNHNPKKPDWLDRDFVFLSNGHICPILYASLAYADYFNKQEQSTLRQINSRLQGHPHRGSLPGIETSSGPLGQGLSQALGLGLALRMDGKTNNIYCLTSDGEHQEGQTWEAYQLGNKCQLDNVTVIVDRNDIQIEGQTEEVMPLGDLSKKIASFGWQTYNIDGHNYEQILETLKIARDDKKPSAIIAHTIPGKGVSFMENNHEWHGKAPNETQTKQALAELKKAQEQL